MLYLPDGNAQVVEAKLVATRQGRQGSQPTRIAECLVGDDSGVMVLTARNDQGENTSLIRFGIWVARLAPALVHTL